jgi:protease-4
MDTAIEIAAAKIGAGEDYRVVYFPETKPWFEEFMTTFSDQVQARVLQAQLGDQYPLYQKVQKLKNYQGVQVRMPQDISIK